MKILPTIIGLLLLAILSTGVWVLRYRPDWLAPAAAADSGDDEVDPQKLEIPVHMAKVTRATLNRYIDAIGILEPAPARAGGMAGTADVAAPVAGIILQVLCEPGQQVKKGDPLVQLDDRLAAAAEQQAAAALAEEKAAQAKLRATPTTQQAQAAQLKVDQAHHAVDFAQKNVARQEELAKSQGTSEKNLEQSRLDLASAKNDLASAENDQAMLKPLDEDLAQEDAKVSAVEAALAAAAAQRQMLRIVSPIDATVVAVAGNAGESVDTTKVLVDLVALDRLVVNVQIPVEESRSLKPGMPTELLLASAGSDGKSIEGKIHFVGAEVDQKTNTIPVSIDVGPDLAGKAEEMVRVRIVAETRKDCLAVPKESIVADENGDSFIAMLSGDQASHKTVKVGLRQGDLIEVEADGLKEGDSIVGSGAYGLAKFQVAKVTVVEQ